MSINQKILELVDKIFPEVVQHRRHFHENPELSSEEFNTSKYLKEYAEKLNLEIEEVPTTNNTAGTGFIATLDTKKPGKVIGLRTDMDALPISEKENNLSGERDTISKNEGVMHACGHDGHMAILLGAMDILNFLKEDLNGKIIFIFEEGEENHTGVFPMIQLLKKKNIDIIYGNHLISTLETGKISASPGPVTSATSRIKMNVIGQSGHASRPDKAINPVFAGSYILTNISSAWNNQLDMEKPISLGITQFITQGVRNVIPEKVYIAGTLRFFDKDIGIEASEVIKNVARNVAKAHNCNVEFPPDFGPSTPSIINEPELSRITESVVEELYPGSLEKNVKWFASETFARYQEVCPLIYSFIGIKNLEKGSGAEHHNEHFDIDEESLKYGIGTMIGFVTNILYS